MGNGDVREARIGIDKEEVIALRFLRELMASPGFSDPSLGQWFAGEYTNSGITFSPLLYELGCSIG
jgi:hypothetical protein